MWAEFEVGRMRKFKVVVETGYAGCNVVSSFVVEDNATEEEIEAEARAVKNSLIEWFYEEVGNNAD